MTPVNAIATNVTPIVWLMISTDFKPKYKAIPINQAPMANQFKPPLYQYLPSTFVNSDNSYCPLRIKKKSTRKTAISGPKNIPM